MELKCNGGKAQKQDRKTKLVNKQVNGSALTNVINEQREH